MKIFALVAATVASSISMISAAHAATLEVTPSISIQYSDLDLSRVEGNASLYRRVQIAAKAVCRDLDPGDRSNRAMQRYLKTERAACLDHAIKAAVAQVNRQSFTDFATAKLDASGGTMKLASN
jgi:UrcA family protein